MNNTIYLDYAATTPVDPKVALKMSEFLTQKGVFGNSASTHAFGAVARSAVEKAREQVAFLINAEPSEIVWTSGATEATNLALKGAAQLYRSQGNHIITMKTEHPSVLDCCHYLEKEGFRITYLTPQENGKVCLAELEAAIGENTFLVSIMHVNNETGIAQDIHSIAKLTSSKGILFHVDAAQSAGKLPLDVQLTPIDLISFSAHKLYGPKGVGALYVRKKPRVRVAAQIHGGGHEQGMRSGTLATHQIVGMGEAFDIARGEFKKDQIHIQKLKNQFLSHLSSLKLKCNSGDHAIPNILNISFDKIQSSDLIKALPNLAISAGSACLSKGVEPSYVLRAMGLTMKEAASGVRFSFGRFTNSAQIDEAVRQIKVAVNLISDCLQHNV